jgi:16S rRNA G966 N2-methylase RsmD
MSVKLQKPTFDTLLQVANGGMAAESPALQDSEQLSQFKRVTIVEFFDAHWFPLKGNREVFRDPPYRKPEVLKRNITLKLAEQARSSTDVCNAAVRLNQNIGVTELLSNSSLVAGGEQPFINFCDFVQRHMTLKKRLRI